MENVISTQASTLTGTQSPQQNDSQPQSFLSDDWCISTYQQFKTDKSILNDLNNVETQKLLAYSREYETLCALEAKYQEAKTARQLAEEIRKKMKNNANTLSNSINNRSGSTTATSNGNSYKTEIDNKYNSQLEEFDKVTTTKRHYLNKRHQQNRERFDAMWTDTMPRKYRKPSYQLLNLKTQEKKLAMDGDYDRASQIHQYADQLAANEAQLAQQALIRDYKTALSKLVSKQQNEINIFEESRKEQRNIIKARYNMELQACKNRSIVLKQRQQMKARCASSFEKPLYTVSISSIHKNLNSTTPNQDNNDEMVSCSNLLPPLLPPTDPKFEQEDIDRQKAMAIKKKEYFKRKEEQKRLRMEKIEKELKLAEEQKRDASRKKQNKKSNQTFVTTNEDMPVTVSENNNNSQNEAVPENTNEVIELSEIVTNENNEIDNVESGTSCINNENENQNTTNENNNIGNILETAKEIVSFASENNDKDQEKELNENQNEKSNEENINQNEPNENPNELNEKSNVNQNVDQNGQPNDENINEEKDGKDQKVENEIEENENKEQEIENDIKNENKEIDGNPQLDIKGGDVELHKDSEKSQIVHEKVQLQLNVSESGNEEESNDLADKIGNIADQLNQS